MPFAFAALRHLDIQLNQFDLDISWEMDTTTGRPLLVLPSCCMPRVTDEPPRNRYPRVSQSWIRGGVGSDTLRRLETFSFRPQKSRRTSMPVSSSNAGLRTAFAKEVACILSTGGSGGGYASGPCGADHFYKLLRRCKGQLWPGFNPAPDRSCPPYPTTTSLGPSVARSA